MAVIEYMLLRDNGSQQRFTPGFVKDRGHHFSPIDNTLIGWIEDKRDYYVPDTIVILTKEKFIERQLEIHSKFPMEERSTLPDQLATVLTDEQVRERSSEWYDAFVFKNTTEDNQRDAAPYPSGASI